MMTMMPMRILMTMMILYDHATVVAVTVVVRICQNNDNHCLAAISSCRNILRQPLAKGER